ncbi:MAG: thioredoxin domain-containing protein [Candidatus Diapherotrites archaeon]|nr:thioredoxin domain-containing protein [Candidatus Diapherotrites archaeon]
MKKVLGILFIALILIFSGSTFAQSNDSNLATSSETTAVSSGSAVENDYLGNLNSNITITEFGGFDEPFSRRFYETTYQELKKKYIDTGKVMFSFNTFPLSFYPNDIESAKASYCARQQNNFWKYFSKLFENKNLEKNKLIDYASELGMNKEKFSNCLDSADAKQFVDNAINYANNNKINGSPTFFIQKEESYIMETPAPPMEIIQGAQSINAFEDILQKFGVKIENIVGTTSAQVNNNAVATETTTTVETVEEIRPLEPFDTTYNEKVLSISGVEKSPLDEYNMPITYNLWNSNPSLGEPNSKIEIVVFGDLQDPFTRQFFNNTFPTIQK